MAMLIRDRVAAPRPGRPIATSSISRTAVELCIHNGHPPNPQPAARLADLDSWRELFDPQNCAGSHESTKPETLV